MALKCALGANLAGYGSQTSLFVPRIAERYEIAVSSNYGLEGAPITWNGIPVLPGLGQDWGNNTILEHAGRRWGDPRGGVVLTLADVWPLEPEMAKQVNMACWCPVDHDPVPPKVEEFLRLSDAIPIAMSRFGEEQLKHLNPCYVPHGLDAKVLKPMDKEEARRGLFPKGAYVVGMVAANKGHPSRKAFSQSLSAFARFMAKHENVYLYLHTSLGPHSHGGESLYALLSRLEIPRERIRAADQYSLLFSPYTGADMRSIYSALDVLMNPSFGEGFGVPIIEAQSCGVPVITTNITAMPELTGAGWIVGGHPYWSMLNSWQLQPNVDEIYDALEEGYALTDTQRDALGKKARKHALKYDVERVMRDHWWPTLKEIERRIEARVTSVSVDRTKTVTVVTPWHDHPEFMDGFRKAIELAQPDEVIVVDSGSAEPVDGAAYRYETNVGQSVACNKGLEMASGDVVVFLNNDVRPSRADWLDALLDAVKPGILAGPHLRKDPHTNVDGQIMPYLDGWCLAGMRQDFERIGAWDTTYDEPAYYGDNDLSLRAVACGMTLREVPNVGLEHLSNGTSGDDPEKRERVAKANRSIYEHRVRDLRRVAA